VRVTPPNMGMMIPEEKTRKGTKKKRKKEKEKNKEKTPLRKLKLRCLVLSLS